MFGTARDITELEQSRQDLHRSEQKLSVTLDSIGDAVLATDAQRRITRLNRIAEQLTGWTHAEAQGRPVDEVFRIINEETRQPAVIPVDAVLATGEIHGLANHTVLIARDGTERPIADSAAPIREKDGQMLGVVLVFRDVTEEHAAQRAVQRSETLNRAVLNSVMAKIAVVDQHGTIIAINESWERFGRENGADTTLAGMGIGANYLDVCGRAAKDIGGEAQDVLDGIRGVLAHSQVTFKHEYACHSPTERRWFSMQVSHLAREEGGAVIAHINITERKQAELLLSDFKAALDEHAIVATTDAKGKITYVNDKFCAISKYAREELLGQDHRIINSGHHPKAFIRELWETITSGRVWKGGIKNRAKDGSFYWVDTTIVPFLGSDGKPTQFIAIRADITERKKVEEALRDSEERRRLATDAAGIGVWDWDVKTGTIKWDEQMFALYGLPTTPGGVASYQDWRAAVLPADLAETEAVLQQTAVTGGRSRREFRIMRASDKAPRVILAAEVAVAGADGQTARVVGIDFDITERKEAEEKIAGLAAELQARAGELEAANKELESFSYSVSHDLRAPLRHVHGYVEMLTKATAGQLPPKAQRYLATITEASVEMGQLIDDLLDFSRMGRAEMQETALDLDQMVRQTLRGLEQATKDRNIVWKIAPLPSGMGDPAMLRQVLSNLIGNAVKYSRPRDLAQIEIGCAGEENGRRIYFVRDNGAGFDMQYAHKLFGVFQRLHRAEEFEGTGIGLATVRRILARHGDRIWAEGEPDKGAVFYFTLKPTSTPI